jgi:hypothetical protein
VLLLGVAAIAGCAGLVLTLRMMPVATTPAVPTNLSSTDDG